MKNAFLILIASVLLCAVGSASADTTVLAYTGQAVPEGNGVYSTFTEPALNAFGQLGFRSDLAGTSGGTVDDRAIYRAGATGATLICRENWWTPDANGRFFALSTPALNNANQLAFRGDATGTVLGAFDSVGIYRSAGPGALDQLIRGNDPSPDGNGRFFIMSDEPLLDDDAIATFWASFTGTSAPYGDDTGVVMRGWGTTTILAREGQTVPGGDGQFSSFLDITENKDQAVIFKASLRNTSAGNDNDTGIFRAQPGLPGTLTQLVREGDAPPDGNGQYRSLHLGPICNSLGDGRATFRGWLRNTSGGVNDDIGVFLATTSGVIRIARDGQSPPDGNGVYTNFNSDTQNDTRVAFVAAMRNTAGGSADAHGIYWGNGLSTHKIARGSDAAPDGNGVLWAFSGPVMNIYGHVAFKAQLTGTAGGSSDNDGLYIGDGYDIVQVARTGDPLLGSTITDLSMADGANCRNGFNRHAQVAYRAVLADGRESLVLFTPPINWQGASGGWYTKDHWTLSIMPDEMYDVTIAPPGGDVAGPRTNATVKSLTIGAAAGGPVTLSLVSGGDVTAVNTCTVMPTGAVEIGAGRMLAAADIVNQGALAFQSGAGSVFGEVVNGPGGSIVAGAGAEAWMHGHVHNQGVVEVTAGAEIHMVGLTGNGCSGDGTVWLGGEVHPAAGIGLMDFGGDAVFGPRSFTYIELDPRAALPAHDRIVVEGDLMLDGTLVVESAATPAWLIPGQRLEIIDVMGTAAGRFFGLDEGDQVDIFGGVPLHITYIGGDGNDVELYAVPEPATLALLALGGLALLRRRRR